MAYQKAARNRARFGEMLSAADRDVAVPDTIAPVHVPVNECTPIKPSRSWHHHPAQRASKRRRCHSASEFAFSVANITGAALAISAPQSARSSNAHLTAGEQLRKVRRLHQRRRRERRWTIVIVVVLILALVAVPLCAALVMAHHLSTDKHNNQMALRQDKTWLTSFQRSVQLLNQTVHMQALVLNQLQTKNRTNREFQENEQLNKLLQNIFDAVNSKRKIEQIRDAWSNERNAQNACVKVHTRVFSSAFLEIERKMTHQPTISPAVTHVRETILATKIYKLKAEFHLLSHATSDRVRRQKEIILAVKSIMDFARLRYISIPSWERTGSTDSSFPIDIPSLNEHLHQYVATQLQQNTERMQQAEYTQSLLTTLIITTILSSLIIGFVAGGLLIALLLRMMHEQKRSILGGPLPTSSNTQCSQRAPRVTCTPATDMEASETQPLRRTASTSTLKDLNGDFGERMWLKFAKTASFKRISFLSVV